MQEPCTKIQRNSIDPSVSIDCSVPQAAGSCRCPPGGGTPQGAGSAPAATQAPPGHPTRQHDATRPRAQSLHHRVSKQGPGQDGSDYMCSDCRTNANSSPVRSGPCHPCGRTSSSPASGPRCGCPRRRPQSSSEARFPVPCRSWIKQSAQHRYRICIKL